jgi:hypothetical protein
VFVEILAALNRSIMRELSKLYFVFRNPDDPDWSEKKRKRA